MMLAYRVDGAGERVLVLSGSLGTTLELWEPQLEAFAGTFRVLRYDHPGHGGSRLPARGSRVADFAAALLDLLDTCGYGRVSFCGLSLGALVGMELATRAPERVDGLALACGAPRIGTPELWRERAATVRSEGIDRIADTIVARWFTKGFAAARPAVVRRYRAMLAGTPPEGYARCCDALAELDFRDSLQQIAAPTLVLSGAADHVVSVEDQLELERRIPGAVAVVLERAAHLPNVECPDEFNRAVLAHLNGEVRA